MSPKHDILQYKILLWSSDSKHEILQYSTSLLYRNDSEQEILQYKTSLLCLIDLKSGYVFEKKINSPGSKISFASLSLVKKIM